MYTAWETSPAAPNNGGHNDETFRGEECLAQQQADGKWNDMACSVKQGAVVEFDGTWPATGATLNFRAVNLDDNSLQPLKHERLRRKTTHARTRPHH